MEQKNSILSLNKEKEKSNKKKIIVINSLNFPF